MGVIPMTNPGIKHNLKPNFKKIGDWGWDDDLLWSKIEVTLDLNECWYWQGSMSPTGALFGAYKNERQQMTQARRIVYMSHHNEDVQPYSVTMTCKNQYCCNPHHFELKANNRIKKWTIFGEKL